MLSLKRSLIVIAGLLIFAACIPQTVNDSPEIFGVALDSETGAQIPNAKIRVVPVARPDLSRTSLTDAAGRFQIGAISHTALVLPLPHAPAYGFSKSRIEALADGYEANAQDLHTARGAMNEQGDIVVTMKRSQMLARR